MNQRTYCRECGKPVKASLNFCKHCGTEIKLAKKTNHAETTGSSTPKKQFTKKQKALISSITAIFLIFIGLFMWGKSYASPEKTVDRFIQAIKDEDHDSIQQTAGLHNGSSLSEEEAKAFIALAKDGNGYIDLTMNNPQDFTANNHLLRMVEDGKWMGIFDRYSFSLQPQYIQLHLPFPGVESTLNGKDFTVYEEDAHRVVYGPASPGIYDMESSFQGNYTEVNSNQTVILADVYSDWTAYDVELTADYVTLELYNSYGVPVEHAYIEINDQQVPFDDHLMIEELGPIELNGSISITPAVETAWGEIESASIDLTDRYHEIQINTLNEVLMDELSEQILLYGETYAEAYASYNENVFTNITDEMKERFHNDFDQRQGWDEYFSGQLDLIEINFDAFTFYNDTKASVPAKFHFTSAFHRAAEEGDLDERIDHCNVELIFDTENNQWFIDSCYTVNTWYGDDFTATKTLDGSQEFYKAGTDTSAESEASGENVENDVIEDVTIDYVYQLVEAINSNDYSIVQPYIKDGSALHTMQSDLVDRLNEDGMTQEVLSASVTDIDASGGKWLVTAEETIKLNYESGNEETEDYVWVYTVEQDGDELVLVDIEG